MAVSAAPASRGHPVIRGGRRPSGGDWRCWLGWQLRGAAGPGLGGGPCFLSLGSRAPRIRGRVKRSGNWTEVPEPCPPGRGTERSGCGAGSERSGARVGPAAGGSLSWSLQRRSLARRRAAVVRGVRWRRAGDARFPAENRQLLLDGGRHLRAAGGAKHSAYTRRWGPWPQPTSRLITLEPSAPPCPRRSERVGGSGMRFPHGSGAYNPLLLSG